MGTTIVPKANRLIALPASPALAKTVETPLPYPIPAVSRDSRYMVTHVGLPLDVVRDTITRLPPLKR